LQQTEYYRVERVTIGNACGLLFPLVFVLCYNLISQSQAECPENSFCSRKGLLSVNRRRQAFLFRFDACQYDFDLKCFIC